MDLGNLDEDQRKKLMKLLSSKDSGGSAGGADNAISGALAGAQMGAGNPMAIAGGAALGAVRSLAKRKQKKQKLQAEAILGQAEAQNEASRGERDALKQIIEGFRSALIF